MYRTCVGGITELRFATFLTALKTIGSILWKILRFVAWVHDWYTIVRRQMAVQPSFLNS